MFILQFIIGIRDSLHIKSSIIRYMFPNQNMNSLELLKKLLKKEIDKDSESISPKIYESISNSIEFTVIVILLGGVIQLVEYVIDVSLGIIYWPIIIIMYSTYAAGMWMRTQEITQGAIKMETDYYLNKSFAEYQIDETSLVQATDHLINRVIYGLLFQIQTNIVCWIVVNTLPLPYSLIKIPIYSLFISIQNISTKIPYKQHLSYYYQQNIGYLIGLNFILSSVLHFSQFPIFTGLLWFIVPLFLLNSLPKEPPIIRIQNNYYVACVKIALGMNDKSTEIINSSFMEHLKQYYNNQGYKALCDRNRSFISFPQLFVPSVQRFLGYIISKIHGYQ